MVFHLALQLATADGTRLWEPGDFVQVGANGTTKASLRCLNMRHEMEIWNQLRNGCVAGRAISYTSTGKTIVPNGEPSGLKPIPLVNVTSLILDQDDPPKAQYRWNQSVQDNGTCTCQTSSLAHSNGNGKGEP